MTIENFKAEMRCFSDEQRWRGRRADAIIVPQFEP
jgi:hypothetical protein